MNFTRYRKWRITLIAVVTAIVFGAMLTASNFALAEEQTAEERLEALELNPDLLPSPERITALEANPDDQPVYMLNLLKFKPNGGQAEYMKYGMAAQKRLGELGASIIFVGTGLPGQDGTTPYDSIAIVEYPTRKGLRQLGESAEYRAAMVHRNNGLEMQVLYAMNAELPPAISNGERIVQEIARAGLPASPETVYMLNLLRFKPDGGAEEYFTQYAAAAGPMVEARGGRLVYSLRAEQIMLGDEEYDHILLVEWPSIAPLFDMIQSEEYLAIAHHRTDAIEVGHVLPYRSMMMMAPGAATQAEDTDPPAEDLTSGAGN